MLVTACALILGCLGLAAPAHAAPNGLLDVTCVPPSSSTATYSPPLTSTPQMASSTVNWELGPCVSLSQPNLTSGHIYASNGPRERTCRELLSAGPRAFTITWNTGQTSTVSANRTTSVVGAVLVVTHTGTITSGLFTGDTIVTTETGAATDILQCTLGLGTVSSVYNLVTLKITSV